MEPIKTTTLRDKLPSEFFDGSFTSSRANKFLDVEVEVEYGYLAAQRNWPGKEKNVYNWWLLKNGYAVGWNENPARGWGFPVVKLKEFAK